MSNILQNNEAGLIREYDKHNYSLLDSAALIDR